MPILKQITHQSIQSSSLTDVIVGTVTSISPLTIQIEQQQEALTSDFLKLTKAVLDHYVDIEVNHVTENREGGSGEPAFASHNHDYIGRKKIMIYNGLHVGEQVLLLQCQGGQDFIVIDRVHEHIVSGQWL